MTTDDRIDRARQAGREAFEAGKPRSLHSAGELDTVMSDDGTMAHDAALAWYAGWDNANLGLDADEATRHYDREYDAVIASGDDIAIARAEGLLAIWRATKDEDARTASRMRYALHHLQSAKGYIEPTTLPSAHVLRAQTAETRTHEAVQAIAAVLDHLDGLIMTRYRR